MTAVALPDAPELGLDPGWRSLMEAAARQVFDVGLHIRLERSDEPGCLPQSECTAMVGMVGAVCGILSLRCSEAVAQMLAARMLEVPVHEAALDADDALGEICNMVAGSFKTLLDSAGDACLLSIPMVITGTDYCLHSLAEGGSLEVDFLCEGEPLLVSLELH